MKLPNLFLTFAGISLLCPSILRAQTSTFDLRFELLSNNGIHYDVKIQIKANGQVFGMGTSSFFFRYNPSSLANPVILEVHNFGGGNYFPVTLNTMHPPVVAVNIELENPPATPVLPTFTDIATIRFTTLAPSGSSNLEWIAAGGRGVVVFNEAETALITPGVLENRNDTPLPVQLAHFIATIVNQTAVRLDWRTLSEINNYGFFVQRKRTGDSVFADLPDGFVPGHGTTNQPHDYSFTDQHPSGSLLQYRLKQVDLDGTLHYSDPVHVSGLTDVPEKTAAPRAFMLAQNFPNPFNPSTEIRFTLENTGHALLEVFNTLGQSVKTLFDDVAEAGVYHQVRFEATGYASGIYFIRLKNNHNVAFKRMLLLK